MFDGLFPGAVPKRFPLADLPEAPVVVVLAPHPDDFDAIALTLHALHERGATIHLAVLTTGVSGVEDVYPGADSNDAKRRIREAEQRASCRLFGLDEAALTFLRLVEDERGHQRDDAENRWRVRDYLLARRPDLAFMPHGHDTNVAHQRTWSMFRDIVLEEGLEVVALLNRDAKTVAMRTDVYFDFDAAAAAWKATLLRAHDSQHARNLRTRGHGFDERVLEVNRRIAGDLGLAAPFAEAFEAWRA